MTEPFFTGDVADNDHKLDQLVQQAEQRAQQFGSVRDQLAEVSNTDESTDGTVRVTVASTGALTDLSLDDSAGKRRPAELAREILRCAQRAQAGIAERAQEIVTATVPEGGTTAEHLVETFRTRFPEPPEPESAAREAEESGLGALNEEEEAEAANRPPEPRPAAPRPTRRPPDDEDDSWEFRSPFE